jgi:triosephosphate isomerase
MRTILIAGNWKMNGSRASIRELLDGIKAGIGNVTNAQMAVCAPSIYIADVAEQLAGTSIGYGAQDVSTHASGAYTGEIAASMINDFGCKYIIVGHSERRTYHNETDDMVAEKFGVVLEAGMTPIFCIGETLEEREKGITEEVVARQVQAVIDMHGVDALGKCVIAYEPVWAIGTGKTASPEQAQEVHAFIRGMIAKASADVAENIIIQYGGSMNAGNAKELLAQPDIDGGLIGGASLKAEDFLAIGTSA